MKSATSTDTAKGGDAPLSEADIEHLRLVLLEQAPLNATLQRKINELAEMARATTQPCVEGTLRKPLEAALQHIEFLQGTNPGGIQRMIREALSGYERPSRTEQGGKTDGR